MSRYSQVMEYLYARLPAFHRIGAPALKPGLGNTLALCAACGDPHHKFKSIHIAGTNGKGTVTHLLTSMCMEAGLKTGMYVSPHYIDYRERIQINGQWIPKKFIVDFVLKYQTVIEHIQPSFFEVTVVLAFHWFAQQQCDIAIIETGLGGRLDSTNVILPELSIITNISNDHIPLLGNTLQEIASEKAGIIKPGIPVIIGESQTETDAIFSDKAKKENSLISWADQTIHLQFECNDQNQMEVFFENKLWLNPCPFPFSGNYQKKNCTTVLAAAHWLMNHQWIIEEHIRNGIKNSIKNTNFIGRWQILSFNPLIVCDGGHNEAGMQEVIRSMHALNKTKWHIILGFVQDKKIDALLGMLPANAQYYFVCPIKPRGLSATELRQKSLAFQLKGKAYASISRAILSAKKQCKGEEGILITGSIFLVGSALKYLNQKT